MRIAVREIVRRGEQRAGCAQVAAGCELLMSQPAYMNDEGNGDKKMCPSVADILKERYGDNFSIWELDDNGEIRVVNGCQYLNLENCRAVGQAGKDYIEVYQTGKSCPGPHAQGVATDVLRESSGEAFGLDISDDSGRLTLSPNMIEWTEDSVTITLDCRFPFSVSPEQLLAAAGGQLVNLHVSPGHDLQLFIPWLKNHLTFLIVPVAGQGIDLKLIFFRQVRE